MQHIPRPDTLITVCINIKQGTEMPSFRILCFSCLVLILAALPATAFAKDPRPNILFFFVDDMGKYASLYADPEQPSFNDVIKTPTFDRIGREGLIFNNAFVPVASCGPCRASLATARHFWNCGSNAFLNTKASDWSNHTDPYRRLPRFGDRLRESGYFVHRILKTFDFKNSRLTKAMREVQVPKYQRYGLYVGTAQNDKQRQQRHEETLAHPRMAMRRVLADTDARPFFMVYGTINVHRPYVPGSGEKLWGIDPDKLKGLIPPYLPDVEDIRRDFADYLGEVMAADAMLAVMVDELEQAGQLDNTIIIVSGDHGIPGVPRGKTNCYDLATRVSMMVRWPGTIKPGRVVEDYISVMDVGPTLLEIAGAKPIEQADGRSFLKQINSEKSGWIDPERNRVVIGRERHGHLARNGQLPYPMRAIRTPEYLYIKNFKPDRWPMGAPYNIDVPADNTLDSHLYHGPFRDIDVSLTKVWLMNNRTDPRAKASIELTLDKRPGEELYDLSDDPEQMHNVAADPDYATVRQRFEAQLMAILKESNDPRLTDAFDELPYVSEPKVLPPPRD